MSTCDMDCYDAVSEGISQAQAVIVTLIANDNHKCLSDGVMSEVLAATVSLLNTAESKLREAWEE